MKKTLILFVVLILTELSNIKAHDLLYIYAKSGTKTTVILDELKYLTFDASSMTINKKDGETSTVNFTDMKFFSQNNYDFSTMISSLDDNVINVFPNPVVKEVIINGLQSSSKIELLDLQGRKLLQTTTLIDEVKIPMNVYPSGMYLLQISSQNGIFIKKLLKTEN